MIHLWKNNCKLVFTFCFILGFDKKWQTNPKHAEKPEFQGLNSTKTVI